jgi:hypothetical protein
LLEINVAETAVEENFARVEFEQQTQLRIVDQRVAAEVEKGVVEIREGFFEVAEEKVGDSFLEICYCEILVALDSPLVVLNLVQQSQRICDIDNQKL